jgi:CPA1 family monovalent cation:H+ antiporter
MLVAIIVSIVIRFAGSTIFPVTTIKIFKLISGVDFTEVLMGGRAGHR